MYFHVYRIYIRTYISWSLSCVLNVGHCASRVFSGEAASGQCGATQQLNKATCTAGSYPGERFINLLAILTTTFHQSCVN